jgi:hypothetical protein
LGGAPLAQGSVYLLLKKRWANILSFMLIFAVLISSVFVLLSPINYALVEPTRMSGKVFVWQWVRYFSPFINLYAVVFLVGGAFVSAYKYFKKTGTGVRFWGNLLIAVGAILPGIGGSFTRLGYVEVLYVTEFMGLFIILIAYYMMKNEKVTSVHLNQI